MTNPQAAVPTGHPDRGGQGPRPPLSTWSLRARLLAGMTALVLVALVTFGSVTVALLRSYQLERADSQLRELVGRPAMRSRGADHDMMFRAPARFQPGSVSVQLFDENGVQEAALPVGYADEPDPLPDLPRLTYADALRHPQPFTVGADGDASLRYRVLVTTIPASRESLVLGLPLSRDDATINRLLVLGGAGIGLVVLAMAGIGLRVIGVGLRPLDDMTDTATAIAGGDLSQRVDVPEERTDEVGRLGRAFNTMLGQIEAAFGERHRSEARLRQFVGDASHELRTPLTSIKGYAELHRRGMLTTPDAVDDAMRRIEHEAGRMASLVDDLLLLARLDQGRSLERRPVVVAAVVEDAVRDLRAVDPERPVTLDHDGGETVVVGDPSRLHQVVANLLDNARVHTPPGTPVHVTIATSSDHVVVRVADEGPGMEPEVTARVFERSFRGDRSGSRSGSGLGLAIVAAIAAAHGGSVAVDSTPGAGSVFTVWLPRGDAHSAAP
jgi:two-component system, OmpR family, sensor kinase